jgi:hypothetical protein
MKTRIVVAEGGDPRAPFSSGLRHPEDFERPWDERHQAQIEIDDSDSIVSILKRGTEALGSELPKDYPSWPFIDFYVNDTPIRFRRILVLVDKKGRARWTYRWHDEPYRELIRAHQAGVLVGDPARIYILRQPGIGNGVLADLPTWVELLRLMFEVGGGYLAAKAGVEALRVKMGKASAAADAIKKYAGSWRANGANANHVWEFLLSKPWLPSDLGRVLGADPEEIESILECLGFVEDEDGTWSIGSDPESQLLSGNAELLIHSPHANRGWVETVLRERLDHFVETGDAPVLDWSSLSQMPVDAGLREKDRVSEEDMHMLRGVSANARFWLRELRDRIRKRFR